MTDRFGNYCKKLLEFCGDEQRTIIVENVAPELVNISFSMHGTRAVQNMIEFLSTPQQIAIVVVALNPSVVTLIKDLNDNHVIQKCLNRFASEDKRFIYNDISAHCVEVATHRHGCCVLQRCIDHASVSQKIQLVHEIYLQRYVLDLADNRFTDALIRRFIGNCIHVAKPDTRKFLIGEMINKTRLDKLLQDSYANYVVQTSLDFADPIQLTQLVECIRPLLPVMDSALGLNGGMGNINNNMAVMNGMGGMNGAMGMAAMNGMNGMPNHGHNMGMNGGMGGMNGGMPMANMGGMNGAMNSTMNGGMSGGMNGMNVSGNINANMNGNVMSFSFPGMNNHFENVGMIGMNDYNPYRYM
ncbi:hypothetical protein BG003_009811 [Podila horticola]|nr:hypothetical protein BG003_009811 [Podila horticola]